jgi:hypothetical protein
MLGGADTVNGGDGNAGREERLREERVDREIYESKKRGVSVL